MLSQEVPKEFVRALQELGLTNSSALQGSPLTGGVSSDIWCVETEHGFVCAKRALSKLRVAADWRAPVERNLYEARWLEGPIWPLQGVRQNYWGNTKNSACW